MNRMTLVLFGISVLALFVFCAAGYAAPQAEWTPEEQKWVDDARALYQKQGLYFSDEQAQIAIDKMRTKGSKGILEAEWTPTERKLIDEIRKSYQRQGQAFTDEQAQIAVKNMREKITQIAGKMAVFKAMSGGAIPLVSATGVPDTAPRVPVGANSTGLPTEEYFASQIAKFPFKEGDLSIQPRSDGFEINGMPYVDSEGRIVAYSFDVVTGDITYIAETSSNHVIKIMRAGSSNDALTIATAVQTSEGWDVQTVTGKRLSGYGLSPLPSGFMVARKSAAFWYKPGRGIKNIVVPNGYLLTPLQRGNVGATGYVLMEKEDADGSSNQYKRLFSSIQSLGSLLHINKKEDYALMNVETGTIYPLNIEAEGKNVQQLSQCTRKTKFINDCRKLTSFESLYNEHGGRNTYHYFWRTQWLKTPSGPMAISMENGSSDIYITDLRTGKKVSALHRTLGINWFDVEQRGDGSVHIVAGMGFSKEEVMNAEELLRTSPDVRNLENDKAQHS